MFPTFISILDIQSWWEVPSIAHFCSLFRTAFNLLDFDIEDLEEALLTDGTEESSWLQELIVRLLSGCLPNNEISTFNYQMFLRRLFRQKCQEHDRYNPFNTDCDFTLLPLRTKVDILHALCDFRLDADDVLDQLKNLEADSLRVEPLGFDGNESAYWYFYGTRLYREDFQKKNNKKKSIWQVICFSEDDWFQLTKKFKNSSSKPERALYHTLSKNFLPELPRLFKEKERQARRRLLENQPRRTSDRLRKLDLDLPERQEEEDKKQQEEEKETPEQEEYRKRKEQEERRKESYERRSRLKEISEESHSEQESAHSPEKERHAMAGKKKGRNKQRKSSTDSEAKEVANIKKKKTRANEKRSSEDRVSTTLKPAPVGRQTNNSLSALDGQIVIQANASAPTHKKKLKTSQVFQQTDEDLQVGMHKILDFVKNHDDAWPFVDPVEEEYAPNYYSIIRRPMDLTRMEDRLDQGYYKTFDKFKSDFQLIVNNCRLYNGVENEYTEMVDNLQKVFEKATEKYLDQISSSDEEIAVENLNSDSDKELLSAPKQTKKKKNEIEEPPRTSGRGRKPALAAQGKRKERFLSDESFESIPEEIMPFTSKKAKKVEKDPKDVKLEKGSKENKKLEKENKKLDKEIKENKKKQKDGKNVKENKKIETDVKIAEKETYENKKNDKGNKKAHKEINQNKKSEKEAKESKKTSKENKKNDHENKRIETDAELKAEKEKESKKQSKESRSKKNKSESKKETKVKEKDNLKKRGRKKKKASLSRSRSTSRSRSGSLSSRIPSPSPVRSVLSTPPPSDADEILHDDMFDVMPKRQGKKRKSKEPIDLDAPYPAKRTSTTQPSHQWDSFFPDEPPPPPPVPFGSEDRKQLGAEEFSPYAPFPFSPKPKDKHNKLRETIEKLKAKSEMNKIKNEFEVDDQLKENKDKNKKDKDEKAKTKHKEKPPRPKKPHDEPEEGDASQPETGAKKPKKKEHPKVVGPDVSPKQSNFDALSLATEQTLKDINKWLDDTPKFAEFSSASNSPSYLALDDFDLLGTPKNETKKVDKPVATIPQLGNNVKKDPSAPASKDQKKKPFRDPSKFFKKREVQRTIDRLQPGKSKGNLITSVQNSAKTDEIFPLGPLSKIKDTKNSLIVKTDTNAPKLSLGSVLNSFGKHKFVDDPKNKEEEEEEEEDKGDALKIVEEKIVESKADEVKEVQVAEVETKTEKDVKDVKLVEEPNSGGGPTPNLSAWFKAFGAPKAPPPQKKTDNKPDAKEEESTGKSERVPVPDPSPGLDSLQPITRQRRVSTGSSVSERSSFSQDLDSPRVGMEERGAYPAPYPSPLHRSPNGASPVMASPRPDISPRSAYPPFNGQMRVGFYQDTVSNKSSPEKSGSPREPSQSPYYQPSDHVYAPNTTQSSIYSYASSPFYSHPPNYSSTNPTPPYNTDVSSPAYYDTSKAGDQYQAKSSQNYTANSPASSQSSPATQPLVSPRSPIVHPQMSPSLHSQHSPSIHSPSIHSPSVVNSPGGVHSPSMSVHSPSVNVHSPGMVANSPRMMSPQMHSPSVSVPQQSPGMNVHSPGMSVHSPGMSVHSPGMNVHSPGMSVHSPGMNVHSPGMSVHSPGMNVHSPQVSSPLNPPSVETFQAQQDDGSGSNSASNVSSSKADNAAQNGNSSAFPVKKRAFMEGDLTQFPGLQQAEMVSRNLQMIHQMTLNQISKLEPEPKPPQPQGLLHQHHQQQIHQAQQKQSQLQQQYQQNLQQTLQQKQQVPVSMYPKATDRPLSTPSPPIQQQRAGQHQQQHQIQQLHQHLQQHTQQQSHSQQSQQGQQSQVQQQQQAQAQRQQQIAVAHSNSESTSNTLRNVPYPSATSQSNPYNSNYGNRDSYPLNIPSARSLQQHQQKLDMSKYTNMGYTGPEVNFSRALQQQYGRPELNYTRTTVQSAISQASQLLNSQVLSTTQPSASAASSVPGYQKQASNAAQQGGGNYQTNSGNRASVESVVERLAAQAQQQEVPGGYKPDMSSSRSSYNSSSLDSVEQTLGLGRNISNLSHIVDRYNNEERMMAGLQASANPYYTDKGLGTSHMFNKTMSPASQIFSQANMVAMNQYSQSMQSGNVASSLYGRPMGELQQQQGGSGSVAEMKSSAQQAAQERKARKKKSTKASATAAISNQEAQLLASSQASGATGSASQGFQSYAGLKGAAPSAGPAQPSNVGGTSSLDAGAISLKSASVVPGSAFNFGPAGSGTLGLGTGLYGDKDGYANFLEDFRSAPNFYMTAAAAHHRSTPDAPPNPKSSHAQTGGASQTYPSFLNPAHHQTRASAYPLGGPPFITPSAQAQLMDTSSQLYQHYLQAGVLNQGLLGAAGAYPPGYHPALAMRQPYDSMSRPSWL